MVARRRLSRRLPHDSDQGIVLPLVLVVSLLISAGLMALAARAWLGLSGSIRQSQARQAREIAEAGVARLVESMNREFAYLLIKDWDPTNNINQWDNTVFTSSICPGSNSNPAELVRTAALSDPQGRYTLESYSFKGSPFYGGKASIRMRGERLHSNGQIGATAVVEQTMEVKPKDCTNSFGEDTATSGFPGLLASHIDLGNNEIKGSLSANVLCLACPPQTNFESLSQDEKEGLIGGNSNDGKRQVDGEVFIGPIDLPPVPPMPAGLAGKPPALIDQGTSITGGELPTDPDLKNSCLVSESGGHKTTSCLISRIDLSGGGNGKSSSTLSIDTTNGSVRLYVTSAGSLSSPSVDFSGQAGIKHTRIDQDSGAVVPGLAADLGLFGNPVDGDSSNDQLVNLAGGSQVTGLWAYFPDGTVGIKGGNNNDPEYCDAITGECFGGEILGAVWAKSWGGTKDLKGAGSSSGVAELVVPSDMGTQLFNRYGPSYALGIRDYVALGVTHWSSFTQSQRD